MAAGNVGSAAVALVTPEEVFENVQLGTIAYENAHLPVFHAWLRLPCEERRSALRDRYVFYSVCFCTSTHIGDQKRIDQAKADAYVSGLLADIDVLVAARISLTEEWFKGIEQLVGAFTENSYVAEGRRLVAIGLKTGVAKFPRIAQTLNVHAAFLDALVGRREKAAKFALQLVRRPYLLPNRRELPALCYRLMYILSAGNQLREYRLALWTGVTHLSANASLRDAFAAQIVKTYRGTIRAMLHGDVPLKYRVLIGFANLPGWICRIPGARTLYLDQPFRGIYLAALYLFDRMFYKKNELFKEANRNAVAPYGGDRGSRPTPGTGIAPAAPRQQIGRRRILITRAMGGLGDLLMMTPGLRALRLKYPDAQIDFAVPKSFHNLFEGFDAVRVIDIDSEFIDLSQYRRWINLTDCPAGRIESIQSPNVRRNRIEAFAKAMGISKWRLKQTAGFKPFYEVKEEERVWADEYLREINPDGRQIIGVQPFAADTYRNWPYMQELVAELGKTHRVLVFNHEPLEGFGGACVHKIVQPLRKSIALLARCEKALVLDSSLLHFSAALGLPTVAIFGAISGRLRTKDYPNVHLLAPRKRDYPCYPCWRHEHKPCHLTNGRESICFRSIRVTEVVDAIEKQLPARRRMRNPFVVLWNWICFGRE